jgi:putative chitinase
MADLITPEQLHAFAPKCDGAALAPALSISADRFEINRPLRLCHWLGQLSHESAGFTRTAENLNYSAKRLTQVWPGRFPTLAEAEPYANNPNALAERVYGGRMGNAQPGDGAKFIGRGFIQITGRANYAAASAALEMPFSDDPSLAATPLGAALIAGWFWSDRGCNALADLDDVEAITRKINGGLVGLLAREELVAEAKTIWP